MSSSEDSTSFNEYTDRFLADSRKMRENDPAVTKLVSETDDKDWVFAEQWTQFGRDVSNSSYLRTLEIYHVLNDYGVASCRLLQRVDKKQLAQKVQTGIK